MVYRLPQQASTRRSLTHFNVVDGQYTNDWRIMANRGDYTVASTKVTNLAAGSYLKVSGFLQLTVDYAANPPPPPISCVARLYVYNNSTVSLVAASPYSVKNLHNKLERIPLRSDVFTYLDAGTYRVELHLNAQRWDSSPSVILWEQGSSSVNRTKLFVEAWQPY
jgi:hypothetical protein